MKKRMLAVFMAVVIAVGFVGYRPQRVYANPAALAVEGYEVLFGILATMGVVATGTDAEKRLTVEDVWESLDDSGRSAFRTVFAGGEIIDGVWTVTNGFDRDVMTQLWNSVSGAFKNDVAYTPPVSGYINYSFRTSKGGGPIDDLVLGSCADSPFVIVDTGDSIEVFALLPSGFGLAYRVNSGGVVSSRLYDASMDTVLQFNGSYHNFSTFGTSDGCDYSIGSDPGLAVSDIVDGWGNFGCGGNCGTNDDGEGIAWGTADGNKFICGTPNLNVLSFSDALAVATDELVPCDTWIGQWDDAAQEGRQVGIITGKDLTGYDTLDDIYNPDTGLVTGLDAPVSPDVPVSPDLGGITNGLTNILNKLKALPAAIGSAVIGEGELNFDKFNDIKFSGVFPFCIPFDLINSLKIFNVPVKEPIFVVKFSETAMIGVPDWTIDLTEYDWVFSIGRTLAYVSFVISLILITRNIIKG